mmetsp:Transcript_28610/g.54711  ORF Transcript_28610/g.54711 Transcript_28610/m.54711 type:complete len:287 (-) Transcript_28610:456-1316(-)|eukprot:CAMPEP_0114252590 /NCGR_PEP_ID=MMETSP0058-20121206/15919_1 /TAXON_ID=36894 /ORGANISM="Pyramimonas parkeae, CCMP726" /LENGTH=286 /DNA_ID=CAMNT_0001366537 /DNA_START=57 /DNA_END=917 /DNA_ORIENTATION=+
MASIITLRESFSRDMKNNASMSNFLSRSLTRNNVLKSSYRDSKLTVEGAYSGALGVVKSGRRPPLHSHVSPNAEKSSQKHSSGINNIMMLPRIWSAKAKLMKALEGTDRGVNNTAEQKANVRAAVLQMKQVGLGSTTTNEATLDGTWRLLYTTELETQYVLHRGLPGPFGKPICGMTGEAYQVIDMKKGLLINAIEFPETRSLFSADAWIKGMDDQTMNFGFKGAMLRGPGYMLPVPGYGAGWFRNVYADGKIRVVMDCRDNIIVCEQSKKKWGSLSDRISTGENV